MIKCKLYITKLFFFSPELVGMQLFVYAFNTNIPLPQFFFPTLHSKLIGAMYQEFDLPFHAIINCAYHI